MRISKDCSGQETRVYERLASLDEETQQRISEKYYHGTRPWQKRRDGEAQRRGRRKRAGASHETQPEKGE